MTRARHFAACTTAAALLCFTAGAQAQGSGLSFSAGLKAWSAEWTTFGYTVVGGTSVVTQVPAQTKTVLIPSFGVRFRDFVVSASGYDASGYTFGSSGERANRKEWDVNAGYYVLPGLAATLGYKRYGQSAGLNYEVGGPTVGFSAAAPLGAGFSAYGSLGLGRLKSVGSSDVKFDTTYRLTETGAAYSMDAGGFVRTLSFTLGYRMQVLNSKQATETQDGRDLTHGLALGVVGSF